MDPWEDRIARPPQRLTRFCLPHSVKLRIAGQLTGEAVNRERRAVKLEEALVDRESLVLLSQVGEDSVGDQRAPAPAPPARDRVEDLVAPGQRAEVVAAL